MHPNWCILPPSDRREHMADPVLMIAWARVALAVVIAVGTTVAWVLLWRGLREMRRSRDQEARDSAEWWEADRRRHKKVMAH